MLERLRSARISIKSTFHGLFTTRNRLKKSAGKFDLSKKIVEIQVFLIFIFLQWIVFNFGQSLDKWCKDTRPNIQFFPWLLLKNAKKGGEKRRTLLLSPLYRLMEVKRGNKVLCLYFSYVIHLIQRKYRSRQNYESKVLHNAKVSLFLTAYKSLMTDYFDKIVTKWHSSKQYNSFDTFKSKIGRILLQNQSLRFLEKSTFDPFSIRID